MFNTADNDYIIDFFLSRDIDLYNKVKSLALTWAQIKELNMNSLVTIGAHTVTHSSLIKLNDKLAYYEIIESKKILEEKLGCEIQHFSYPFGSRKEVGRREFAMVKKIGFKTATTTRLANLFYRHSEDLEALPRITINSITNYNILELQTSGFIPAISNKFKFYVTE